jgi:sugar (pentulose or hexulose) kinase
LLAGAGCQVWPSIDSACEATVETVAVSTPDPERAALLDRRYALFQSIDTPLRELLRKTSTTASGQFSDIVSADEMHLKN